GDDRPQPDEAIQAQHRPVVNDDLDADERAVADGAAVQHRLMPHGDVVADDQGAARIGVQDGPVLDVGSDADVDRLVIAAQDRAGPYARILAERHAAATDGFRP